MIKKLFGLVIVVVLVVALYKSSTSTLQVQVTSVTDGPLASVLEERAKTSLPRIHKLAMPQDGRVLPIEVREGDRVELGQELARLDPQDLESDVLSARAQVGLAEANIGINLNRDIAALSLTEYSSIEEAVDAVVSTSEEKEKASASQLEYSEWWLKSLLKAKETQAVSEQQVREAQMQTATSEVGLTSDRLITSALRAFRTAMHTYPKYVDAFMKLQDEQLGAQKKQLESAQIDLQRVERNRARDVVLSPVAGVVLRRHVADELVLPAGTLLLEVGDLSTMEITAEVLTHDVLAVEAGQSAEILGLGDEPLPARIDRIEPAAFTKLSSLGVEEQRVRVVAVPDEEAMSRVRERGLPLGVGYSVRLRITTESRSECLRVSRRALIRESGGRWSAFVVEGGKARSVTVELGLIGEREAEVLSGLSSNQRVVLSPPSMLSDGDRVDVEEQ